MYKINDKKPNICIIVGPTAIGKTNISIAVAKKINGEIISADSAQVYKYMDIGTAKIRVEEMRGIKHYMIDEIYPHENFSVAEFRDRAEIYINDICLRKKLPLIVGGTGLYINSLLNNLDFTPTVCDETFRAEMQWEAEQKGNEYVHGLLKDIDPISYCKLHPNDVRRVIRALEVYKHTGTPISYFQEESRKVPPRYNYVYYGLTMDRKKLYDRIDKRVETMIEQGLVEEVRGLLNMGYTKELVSMQALGYKEIVNFLEGEYSLDEAVTIIQRDSRHYAKRQLTWFRRDERIQWINLDNYTDLENIIKKIIQGIAGKFVFL